jgi:integrase
MDDMQAPVVPEQPDDVLPTADARDLLKLCKGTSFVDRRDIAIIILFLDTGMRLSELAGLSVDDLDMEADVAYVLGKDRRPRGCPFGAKAGHALDRYLRTRAKHHRWFEQALWLGEKTKGPMTANGIAKMVRRRGRQAGIDGLHPHQFRHIFAHTWLSEGGTRVISCASPAGATARCSAATAPPQPTNAPATPTAASLPAIGYDSGGYECPCPSTVDVLKAYREQQDRERAAATVWDD